MQVGLDQVAALAGQWQTVGAQLTAATPPAPGPPFQPSTIAVDGVNALVAAAGSALAARTQETATGASTATVKYASQEATNAVDMSGVTQVRTV